MQKTRFALIGCGNIGMRHAKQMQIHGSLVAVCDTHEARARQLGEEYGVPIFTELPTLITNGPVFDVLAICTPNGLHSTQAIQALSSGHNVLVEKPMALTTIECQEMMQAALENKRQLYTVVQNRFNPPVREVKKALDLGAFGEISGIHLSCFWNRDAHYYQNSWRGSRDMDGGILYTQFSHFVDLLFWFFGDIDTVSAIACNADHQGTIEIEDAVAVLVKFSNGIIGTLHFSINSYGKNREGGLTIIGRTGTVKIGGEYLNKIDYQQFATYDFPVLAATAAANDYGSYKGSMSNHDKVYASLVENIERKIPYYTTPFEAFKTVEIIGKIYRAAGK